MQTQCVAGALALAGLAAATAPPARARDAGVVAAADAAEARAVPGQAPLGVTLSGWRGRFTDAKARIETFRKEGFEIVSFVPAYAYVGLDDVDLESGPTVTELAGALEVALRAGLGVVVKPHLEPLAHKPGYNRMTNDNHSWRVETGWRGFFDLDPMAADYREGVVFAALRAVKEALERSGGATTPPVRVDLGAELMNSVVYGPERWVALLAAAKKERRRLGLEGRVRLSHNFSHHVAIPEDFVLRMDARRRRTLGRYVEGLDALALSQYMDLTVAVPAAERGRRLPTADEVASALAKHERDFRSEILEKLLGVAPKRVPPFHLGEFGVGAGGLRHPNLWGGTRTAEQERALAAEIARGYEGLVRYLQMSEAEGRTAGSAVLWVTGPHFDLFGWGKPQWAVPGAVEVLRRRVGR